MDELCLYDIYKLFLIKDKQDFIRFNYFCIF